MAGFIPSRAAGIAAPRRKRCSRHRLAGGKPFWTAGLPIRDSFIVKFSSGLKPRP
jgi:hypothetical protein